MGPRGLRFSSQTHSLGMLLILLCALSFLAGSIPFGWIAGRMKGMDIRQHGSGNIGATNVKRVLGWGPGLTVFALDVLKGAIAGIAAAIWPDLAGGLAFADAALITGICAFLGHMFTPWLGFKGGKGIATGLGAYLGASWIVGLSGFGAFVLLLLAFRYVSLASLLASALVLVLAVVLVQTPVFIVLTSVAVGLIFWSHRANIGRLAKGQEPKFK